jgi:lipopolysaccharide/colanic/teichoic acid biosynthesis glycosyltransferase
MGTGGAMPRWVEVPVAALGLVLLSPILGLAAVAIKATSRGPALFKQQRVGLGGQCFTLFKFRTMRVQAGGPQVTVRGDSRITAIGGVLRHLKLDEIPELWNVVLGDMSLVGPRPEVPELVDLGSALWQQVLQARPGVTDPVTVRLRNEEVILAATEGDLEGFYRDVAQPFKLLGYRSYLERRTWLSDVRVLFQTVRAVLAPASVVPPSVAEMKARVEAWKAEERTRLGTQG